MATKKHPSKSIEIPYPGKIHKIDWDEVPENPATPEEVQDKIPDEDSFETPPEEIPEPGEGP